MPANQIADESVLDAAPKRRGLRRYAKVAGGIVGGLVLLDLIAGALTIWFGAGLLRP